MFGVDRVCGYCGQATLVFAYEDLVLYDKEKDDLGRGLKVRDKSWFIPVVEQPFLIPAPFLAPE
eukprot:9109930-Heterocapsa_arctica.AAC.1